MVRLATSDSKEGAKQNSHACRSEDKTNDLKELRFHLSHSLQASLEINATLETFFRSTQDFLRISGMVYRYRKTDLEILLGKQCTHSISYHLTSDEAELGNIVFSRAKSFLESELAVLEMLIGVLCYPLRNALLYREALACSMRDGLTGIGNRLALDACFARELKLARRHGQPISILLIDVDHFKAVNDSVGHRNGDRTLQHVVTSIKSTLRETDQVFRFGGEEFVALLNNTGMAAAKRIAERIRANVAASPVSLGDRELHCTVSIGASTFSGDNSAEQLFEQADAALYQAKNAGRNRVNSWSPAQMHDCKSA